MTDRATFSDMAVELRCICSREAMGLEQLEVLAHSDPALMRILGDVRRSAEVLAQAAELLRILIPLEARVRSLILVTSSDRRRLPRIGSAAPTAPIPTPTAKPAEARP